MKKPLIGVTCNSIPADEWTVKAGIAANGQEFQGYAKDYVDMITKAGGVPCILPIIESIELADPLWNELDGVMITGGNDINPEMYGETADDKTGRIDVSRDYYESKLLHYSIEKKIPVLGICRGLQLINAVMGGKNYLDLDNDGFHGHYRLDRPRNETVHSVSIATDSNLFSILNETTIGVNSFHHQAVKTPSDLLNVAAISEDGLVEALEMKGDAFFLAVQWHPEMMFDNNNAEKIASAFIKAASND